MKNLVINHIKEIQLLSLKHEAIRNNRINNPSYIFILSTKKYFSIQFLQEICVLYNIPYQENMTSFCLMTLIFDNDNFK